ncbi:MAG TPA: hypothetical protein VE974_21645 [Thermoanaerobaculia bacterium]|nr:hypothetical protein [Thermoanaerobaculia bacterium]
MVIAVIWSAVTAVTGLALYGTAVAAKHTVKAVTAVTALQTTEEKALAAANER